MIPMKARDMEFVVVFFPWWVFFSRHDYVVQLKMGVLKFESRHYEFDESLKSIQEVLKKKMEILGTGKVRGVS